MAVHIHSTQSSAVAAAKQWRLSRNDSSVGSGCCSGVAPRHFRLDQDERSHPTSDTMPPDDAILDAADLCPAAAILVLDARTGEVLGP
jgi:ferredoxin